MYAEVMSLLYVNHEYDIYIYIYVVRAERFREVEYFAWVGIK